MAWSESLTQNRPWAYILIGENGHKGIPNFGTRIGKEYKCEKNEEQQKRLEYGGVYVGVGGWIIRPEAEKDTV